MMHFGWLKTEFVVNISHKIPTPLALALILSPVRKGLAPWPNS
ncbi:MAG: hypothetical protein ABSE35_15430 [Bryobacteraceae bacterium]